MDFSGGNDCPVTGCSSSATTRESLVQHFTSSHSTAEQQEAIDGIGALRLSERSGEFGCPIDGCESRFTGKPHRGRHLWGEHDHDLVRDLLTDHIVDLHGELGKRPTSEDIDSTKYGCSLYYRFFSSWPAVLESAGFEPYITEYSRAQNHIEEESLLGDIDRVRDELDKTPTLHNMRNRGKYGTKTYWNRFGSWNDALKEAGYEPNVLHDGDGVPSPYYGPNWGSIREAILERDDHQCQVCGTVPGETTQGLLHIHHIVPARNFGVYDSDVETDYENMNAPSNLISLCPSCHSTFEGNWTDVTPDEFANRGRALLRY